MITLNDNLPAAERVTLGSPEQTLATAPPPPSGRHWQLTPPGSQEALDEIVEVRIVRSTDHLESPRYRGTRAGLRCTPAGDSPRT